MLALGMVPLVTDRRGFDGLDGPRARWLIAAGIHDYRPSTLDKTLGEMALLNTADALWQAYGNAWKMKVDEWSQGGPTWRQVVTYIDITTDPYWTRRFAKSGKVSRVGRVMPCLSRVAVMGGCGFPLIMDTRAGTTSLKSMLLGALTATGRMHGSEEMSHLTVVDAEAASFEMLTILNDIPGHEFITVLKGAISRGVTLHDATDWEAYRGRDQIRSGRIVLQKHLHLFAVEMQRSGSRHPHSTMFITSASPELLTPSMVCDAYLSRWPHQEGRFRSYRNGAGLNHSHGFGGEYVTHLALAPKREKAERTATRADHHVEEARQRLIDAQQLQEATPADQRLHTVVKQAKKDVKSAEKVAAMAGEAKSSLDTTPTVIYERDTTRENIATVSSLTVTMLVEWVLREYMGGTGMELRTFLEYFLYAPTEIRTRAYRVLYRIDITALLAREAELLRKACSEATRRRIRRDGRLLVFEVVESHGSIP
jgi:hypothetical protein